MDVDSDDKRDLEPTPTLSEVVHFQMSQVLTVILLVLVSSIANYGYLNTLKHEFPSIDILPVLVNQNDDRVVLNTKLKNQLELFFLNEEQALRENLPLLTLTIVPTIEWSPDKILVVYQEATKNVILKQLIHSNSSMEYFTFSRVLEEGSMYHFAPSIEPNAAAFINEYIFSLLQSTEIPESLKGLGSWPKYIYIVKICFLGIQISEWMLIISTMISYVIHYHHKMVYLTFSMTLISCFTLMVFVLTLIITASLHNEPVFIEYNLLQYLVGVLELVIGGTVMTLCYVKSRMVYTFYRNKVNGRGVYDEEDKQVNEEKLALSVLPVASPSSSKYSDSLECNILETALNVVSNSSEGSPSRTMATPLTHLVQTLRPLPTRGNNEVFILVRSAPVLGGAARIGPENERSIRRNTWQQEIR
ncbi:uncharacterized protein KQ657_003217 [Scheffersomyces spartinae]|uniref:Uncharacterized protein n=1 Tax=Scheffersomyces spartinae TaxID=45513 RepID=A0A9P7VCT1_9ASCO|nr:uncharacterized protein KQ657_003217 [Scheffersomyces spartinae]KAG7195455.1 hypothetical protein KQ657_003217 [Scheffersomyces spartinae]